MNDQSKKTTVTLEDLLRVKRAERPPVEFWAQFECDLRAKQLAAIVEPRPWWAPLIRVGARMSRLQLPVGATAVLVLSFVVVSNQPSSEFGSGVVVTPAAVSARGGLAPTVAPMSAPEANEVALREEAEEVESFATTVVPEAVTTGQNSHTVPLVVETRVTPALTPSARYIAANLAAAQADDPSLVEDVFGRAMRAAESRQPMRDPLAQISTAREARRSRLLSTALPASVSSNDLGVPGTDRVSRHLTEERLYDTISRVGLSGDRVAIKF